MANIVVSELQLPRFLVVWVEVVANSDGDVEHLLARLSVFGCANLVLPPNVHHTCVLTRRKM